MNYLNMTREQLAVQLAGLQQEYARYQQLGLKLDMSRGKPSPEQLDLSMDLLKINVYRGETGIDARNYGVLEGMPEARRLFGELMGVAPEEVIVGGNASLQMMYYLVELGYRNGYADSPRPWKEYTRIKFLCPSPGYDRHFRITEYFGFELVSVPMLPTGPNMDVVERLVAEDDTIKGIWCVPMYSNPEGITYSDETVRRFARMKTKAPDFKIFWDNAYCVHHISDEPDTLLNLMDECRAVGTQDRPFLFCSTSKITFSGAGVAAIGASAFNVQYILKNMFPMTISFDKINQLRHVAFFKNRAGIEHHMEKHKAILRPKFETVNEVLREEALPYGPIASWKMPKGGYFICLHTLPGCARRVVDLCAKAGVTMTEAGATHPYGIDPGDDTIRIAPSFPPVEELRTATKLLCLCLRIASVEHCLEQQ